MISDQPLGGMYDNCEILEWKEFCRSRENAWGEFARELPVIDRQFTRRIEFECAGIFPACLIETASQVVFDAQLMMNLCGISGSRLEWWSEERIRYKQK